MRAAVFLVLAGALFAEDKKQVAWSESWKGAFEEAREDGRPVMVCINSKDGESANERAAKKIYKDKEFIALTRKFVLVVVSVHKHRETGTCPRFGRITCKQHNECYKDLESGYMDQFMIPGTNGRMISPQHAWFKPDGTLVRRKEYELTKPELMKRMRQVLDELEFAKENPDDPGSATNDPDAPLGARDHAELERVKKGDKEARRAALGNLLATGKKAAVAALLEMAPKSKEAVRCDIIRAFGLARVLDARVWVETNFKQRSELVRSFAAVSLEEMGQKESIEILLKRVKKEKDTQGRKNAYRALGVCGGGAADKKAAKALLAGLKDKQKRVAKHAAIATRHFTSTEGKKLVVPKLENALRSTKTPEVRGGIIYALAYVGNKETTVPILRDAAKKAREDYSKRFIRAAIAILEGKGGGFGRSTWWLFAEDRTDPARDDD